VQNIEEDYSLLLVARKHIDDIKKPHPPKANRVSVVWAGIPA